MNNASYEFKCSGFILHRDDYFSVLCHRGASRDGNGLLEENEMIVLSPVVPAANEAGRKLPLLFDSPLMPMEFVWLLKGFWSKCFTCDMPLLSINHKLF